MSITQQTYIYGHIPAVLQVSQQIQSEYGIYIYYVGCMVQEGKRGNSFSGIAKSIYSDSHEMPNLFLSMSKGGVSALGTALYSTYEIHLGATQNFT